MMPGYFIQPFLTALMSVNSVAEQKDATEECNTVASIVKFLVTE